MDRMKTKVPLTIPTVRARLHFALPSSVPSGPVGPVTVHGGTLALVEESAFRDSGLVLGGHLDIGWGQQEHLVGNTFDAAV
ncbi:hypothetical protein GCM10022252_14500 [Streptosporangium oxazolinicum]|uniref:Uncharacterized protein n=1 Tax=Streptosporangium oxazolinicum TaxID=909287 RepID=A0ABP8AJE3_9ACTN